MTVPYFVYLLHPFTTLFIKILMILFFNHSDIYCLDLPNVGSTYCLIAKSYKISHLVYQHINTLYIGGDLG